MTKPLRYDSSINFRLPRSLHEALIEAAGGQERVHPRLRALITQYVGKRARERSPNARVKLVPLSAEVEQTGAEPATSGRSNPS